MVNVVSLNGNWKLYYFPQDSGGIQTPDQLKDSGLIPIPAQVPGNVELDLMAIGELPDLMVGTNITTLKNYELYEWWYEKQFSTPDLKTGQKVNLIFHGVDCTATYWLNGQCIGSSDNMLIEHVFEVSHFLSTQGSNTITIRIKSPMISALDREFLPWMSMHQMWWDTSRLWMRKAAHSYAWDIMPRALSAGVWRSVELEIQEQNVIKDLYFSTAAVQQSTAQLVMNYQLIVDPQLLYELEIRCFGECEGSTFDAKETLRFKSGTLRFQIHDARLWWPRGYGKANLYQVTTQILHRGKVLAERSERIGVRTLELLRTNITDNHNPGEFLFKVNGTPILAKGSNWVPADVFHSKDAAKYERLLGYFSALNCNMLRSWGGGVYEDHAFFDLCDAHGIMVWQDFAMACGLYPQDEQFYEIMRKEAVAVVTKLRNHASLALWCGDNECDQNFWGKGIDPNTNKITREILKDIVFKYDPKRPYVPSSPYYSPEVVAAKNVRLTPEAHLWGPRDYFKSEYYKGNMSHFIGEIGYHGSPNLSSIKKFIEQEYLWPWQDNEQWIVHATEMLGAKGLWASRIKLMADQIKELFGCCPDNIEDFVLASQISQAEAKKFFVEMTRLKKWRRTGVLWWNMADGWPQFSDAIIDYYGEKKLAYHYIARVQQPVCLMIDEPEGWHVQVVAGNDSREDKTVDYKIWDADSGHILLQGTTLTQANENKVLGKIRISNGEHKLYLMQWRLDGKTYGNHYLHGYPAFSLEQYKKWMIAIADLQKDFEPQLVGV
jgi:beta-mannosidase